MSCFRRAYVVPTGGYESIKGGKEGRQKLEHDLERWIATQVTDYKRLRGGQLSFIFSSLSSRVLTDASLSISSLGVHLIEAIPKS